MLATSRMAYDSCIEMCLCYKQRIRFKLIQEQNDELYTAGNNTDSHWILYWIMFWLAKTRFWVIFVYGLKLKFCAIRSVCASASLGDTLSLSLANSSSYSNSSVNVTKKSSNTINVVEKWLRRRPVKLRDRVPRLCFHI